MFEDLEPEEKLVAVNPDDSGMVASWFWGGRPYELKPGEAKAMKPFMAEHARKHNPFLRVADAATSQVELAKMQKVSAQTLVDQKRRELERASEELRRATALEKKADANLKDKEEEDRKLALEQAEARQIAEQAEKDRVDAAKRSVNASAQKPK